jgi:multiple sugar transport system substrate-binding protein
MRKIKLISLSITLVIVMVLTGCSGGKAGGTQSSDEPTKSSDEQITITVASFYPVDQTSGWSSLVERFEAENPGIKIEVQYTPGDQYIPKLLTQMASGTIPDVIGVEVNQFAKFISKDVLADLTPYLEADQTISLEDYFPKLIDYYSVDGKLYGLPYDSQPLVPLFYNKKAFDEAGVPYPTDEWDWNDLQSAALKLTKTNNGKVEQYGFYTSDWKYFVHSNGVGIVDDIKNPTKATLDDPRAIEGLQYYVDLIHKDKVSPSPATLKESGATGGDMFATGKIAMYLAGYWELVFAPERWKELDIGMVMAPKGLHGERGYSTGGTAYAVANGSKHPEEAFAFVKYFMGKPGWEAASKSAKLGIIYPPAHIPSFESDLYLNMPNPPIENMQINGEGTKYSNFPPYNVNWVEIQNTIINPKMDLILLNQLPVKETLKEITPEITQKLNQPAQ